MSTDRVIRALIRLYMYQDRVGAALDQYRRCRELLWQIDSRNTATRVHVSAAESRTLGELLPHPWR